MIIDEKDKKILYYLDEDAFQPFSAIAKKTRLSKQVVAYRIEELKRKGILIKTCAIVNLAKLGYEFFKFYIKYEAITKEKETEVLRKLDAHPRVGYMCVCDGRFDLFIGVWATDIHDLYSISKEIFNRYKTNFKEIVVSAVEVAFNSKRGYLINLETKGEEPLFGGKVGKIELDNTDKSIIRLLTEDARIKYVDIAQKTGITPAAVAYRIKNMKKNGIIEGARIVLDKSKIGYLTFKVLIKTGPVDEKDVGRFIKYASEDKNIVDIDLTLGDWDIELDIEVENHEKFHQIMLELRTAFPNVIHSYDSLLVFREHTYDYFPIGKETKGI